MGLTTYGFQGQVNVPENATPPPNQTLFEMTGKGTLKSGSFAVTYDYGMFLKITIDGNVLWDASPKASNMLGGSNGSGVIYNIPFNSSVKVEYFVPNKWSNVRNMTYAFFVELEV